MSARGGRGRRNAAIAAAGCCPQVNTRLRSGLRQAQGAAQGKRMALSSEAARNPPGISGDPAQKIAQPGLFTARDLNREHRVRVRHTREEPRSGVGGYPNPHANDTVLALLELRRRPRDGNTVRRRDGSRELLDHTAIDPHEIVAEGVLRCHIRIVSDFRHTGFRGTPGCTGRQLSEIHDAKVEPALGAAAPRLRRRHSRRHQPAYPH